MKEPIMVWVTQYALSTGIEHILVIPYEEPGTGAREAKAHYPRYFQNSSFFLDQALAVQDAEDRRTKKIASLKKQIAKLEKLKF